MICFQYSFEITEALNKKHCRWEAEYADGARLYTQQCFAQQNGPYVAYFCHIESYFSLLEMKSKQE